MDPSRQSFCYCICSVYEGSSGVWSSQTLYRRSDEPPAPNRTNRIEAATLSLLFFDPGWRHQNITQMILGALFGTDEDKDLH